jgi:hypothetical protein
MNRLRSNVTIIPDRSDSQFNIVDPITVRSYFLLVKYMTGTDRVKHSFFAFDEFVS